MRWGLWEMAAHHAATVAVTAVVVVVVGSTGACCNWHWTAAGEGEGPKGVERPSS